ncbi:MAG TPA: ATP-binding protein [Trebonia sp.]
MPEYVAVLRAIADRLFAPIDRGYDAALVTSELAGNSTRHSRSRHGGSLQVSFEVGEHSGRIEVVDAGPDAEPVPSYEADEHGRGLIQIVDHVAEKWGHDVDAGRHVWWAELSW